MTRFTAKESALAAAGEMFAEATAKRPYLDELTPGQSRERPREEIDSNDRSEETTSSKVATRPVPKPAAHAVTEVTPMCPSLPHGASVKRREAVGRQRPVDAAKPVAVRDLTVPGGPVGETWLRIFRPVGATEPLSVVVYIHGDDSVLSNARTGRLASRLATDEQVAVVVVDYSLSPRARYPVAIEENYAAAAWIAEHGNEHGLDGTRIVVVADRAGRTMAAELMVMADERDGPALAAPVLSSPRAAPVRRAGIAA